MDRIKLSICLPVYNQPEELERLLGSIISQMTPDVELIVRDDSTNDETENIIKKFSKRLPIHYFHGVKEGVDQALIFLFEQSQGEFVWWIGDDDISRSSIGQVIKIIDSYSDVSFIWANFRIHNSKFLAIDFPQDRFFCDCDELLEKAIVGLGFISSCVFRRSAALNYLEESRNYIGSEFVSLFLILGAVVSGRNYYLRGPLVIAYPASLKEIKDKVIKGTVINNRAFEVFGLNFMRIVRRFSNYFSKHSIRKAIKESFGQTWRGMLVGWVGGWDTPKGKRWKMFKLYWSFPEFWIAIIPLLMPLWVNKVLYKIYKVFFSHRKWIFGENLRVFLKK